MSETQSIIEPKVKTLEFAVGNRLGLSSAAAPASKAARPTTKTVGK